MDESIRDQVLTLFAEQGVTGEIRLATSSDPTESVFVVSSEGAARMNERELTLALTRLLRTKVWITTDGSAWTGRTEEL